MRFDLTPERHALRHAAPDFMCRERAPEVIRRALAERGHSDALWRRLAKLGWLGVAIDLPELVRRLLAEERGLPAPAERS